MEAISLQPAAVLEERVENLLSGYPPDSTAPPVFLGARFDAGLALVDMPEGLGGIGTSPALQGRVEEALRSAGAPDPVRLNPIGVGMGIPTIRQYGNDGQLHRYLRSCFTGETVWCQLFSEPGAGSDVAALATRATRDGDEWVVSGQKVWTSLAHLASVGMLLARTDTEEPKHRGLTYFLVDMRAPGVEVRPLRQMTGDAEFNEVFLSDVRIADADRLGAVGDGWNVAVTTLMNERVLLSGAGSGVPLVGGGTVDRLFAQIRARGLSNEPVLRDEVILRYVEGRVIKMTNARARAQRGAGRPGPEGSVTKLFQCQYNRRLQDTAMRVAGVRATAWESGDASAQVAVRGFLRAQANTIEGGTSDIQRNVLGERVLGLPKDRGLPPETPWSQLPKNG